MNQNNIKERIKLVIANVRGRMEHDTREGFLTNLAVLAGALLVVMIVFFYLYLPLATKHFNSLEMPDVTGKTEAEVIEIMDDAGLRYEIIDSTFVKGYAPCTVVSQNPKPKSAVKSNRKVYLIMQKVTSPSLKISKDIMDQSEKNAREQLQAQGLTVSNVSKAPWCYEGTVLAIRINGQTYRKREFRKDLSAKYSDQIELVVSDGSMDNCVNKEY